jgi:hypothetical protein
LVWFEENDHRGQTDGENCQHDAQELSSSPKGVIHHPEADLFGLLA